MSLQYTVSRDGRRIDTYPKGLLDINTAIKYFDKLKNDNRIKPGATEIVHFKYVTDFKISYSESKMIVRNFQEPKALLHIETTIFVCESSIAFGIGRMLKTLNEVINPRSEIILVRSEHELEEIIRNT